ncbi:hypothetical protein Lfu02_62590 [Longispora fulva]|uniref:ABC-type transport system involved in multi-copper enzyme maturation permease subunit n=1 Tax=Longispora fulva TaxID=619741 RepID=A0A8J7GAC1_9ACTN|nr:ABC transporter permease subunit [Longispora fulva]MBG6134679.1 ABC-type transport system involved in multi-copper enzyme maturation permease subunit [Longispora fulva]GIG61887.1 hypothetical protein Lfu02_62590 [Longispora fulva]
MGRLIRSELLKFRTTDVWWILGLIALVATAGALVVNVFQANASLTDVFMPSSGSTEELESMRAHFVEEHSVRGVAPAVYVSGQFLGLLVAMLLGIGVVRAEFAHRTASVTFLCTPRRAHVIGAKFLASSVLAAVLWAATTALNTIVGIVYFSANGYETGLTYGGTLGSMLLNLFAYAVWAAFGVGFATLLRGGAAAPIVGVVLYLISMPAAFMAFDVFGSMFLDDTTSPHRYALMVALPAAASQVMTTPGEVYRESPAQWVGAAVMIGYGLLSGLIGAYLTRRRDIEC